MMMLTFGLWHRPAENMLDFTDPDNRRILKKDAYRAEGIIAF